VIYPTANLGDSRYFGVFAGHFWPRAMSRDRAYLGQYHEERPE
jgi:hypothetical protein